MLNYIDYRDMHGFGADNGEAYTILRSSMAY